MGKNRIITVFTLLVLALFACRNFESQPQRIAVAKAGEKILYYDEIPNLIQAGMSKEDSIAIIRNYINKWAKREILKLKAIENLTADFRTEVEKELDEIRTNLLIHRYQQQMVSEKLDTLIEEQEIESYYASSASTFILNNNIIRALFIKVPSNIPELDRISSLFRSNDQSSLAQLELLCYQFADKFDDFDEEWIPMVNLLAELPINIDSQEDFLKRNPYFETSDSLFTYYVRIRDYKLRGSIAPYDYARKNIQSIILNTRKMNFLQELEAGVFSEAIRTSTFKIYQ